MGFREFTSSQLDALVSGKRRLPRLSVELPVRIKCAEREFEAVARDLSLEGARIELDPALLTDEIGEPLDPVEQFTFLERHFGDSFDLEFTDALVVVEARVRRLALGTELPESFSLGCQFAHPLGAGQQRTLGLTAAETPGKTDWDVAVGVHDLDHEADPARPVTAMLLDDHAVVSGPLFLGPITAVGRRAVVVRLDGTRCDEVSAALSRCEVDVRLLRGADPLLATVAELVSARYTDGARPGCDVLLALRTRLPRSVRKSFRRAA